MVNHVTFPDEWQGTNPMFLIIVQAGQQPVVIDLDEPGWIAKNSELMRAQGTWHLFRKDHTPVFSLVVWEGEQPYYTARHIGTLGREIRSELIAYGIGKKRLDGHVDRLWVLPNGQICTGDDVDPLARSLL